MITTINKIPTDIRPSDRVIKLQPYQDRFIFSKARFPALVSAWATGKTMSLIEKIRLHAEQFPNNLSMIVRKEFTDLRDSTIKDWNLYTGIKVDSEREAKFKNGSIVMFRHAEELHGNNLNNINLGSWGIEQAEEFDNDDVKTKLRGRLRRCFGCTKIYNAETKKMECVCFHFGAIIANTKGHNWIYKDYKINRYPQTELIEASSLDNFEHVPANTREDWKRLQIEKPKIYNRFVLNSWDDEDSEYKIIDPELVRKARSRIVDLRFSNIRRIIGVDVSRSGNDKTIAYALENGIILDKLELEKCNNMQVVGNLILFAQKNKSINNFAVDEIGVGSGVCDRLQELGKNVIIVNSAEKSNNPRYKNIRAEIHGYGAEQFENGLISFNGVNDDDLFEQLSWSEWKDIDSMSKLLVQPKDEIIEKYRRSPDNADAYLYGLWGLQFCKESYGEVSITKQHWVHPKFRGSLK